jgi:hypothetical protein
MTIDKIKKVLNETLFGPSKNKRGVIEFGWKELSPDHVDELYQNAKKQLELSGISTKYMKMYRDYQKISIVLNQDQAQDTIDIMSTFGFVVHDTIFDTRNPEENPTDYYPELSSPQQP